MKPTSALLGSLALLAAAACGNTVQIISGTGGSTVTTTGIPLAANITFQLHGNRPDQRPVKFGARFSMKAATPSA